MSETIQVQVDHQGVTDALSRLADAIEKPDAVLRSIGEWMLATSQARFSTQTTPEGLSWLPLQHWYKQSKPKNKDKALTLNGYLRNTLAWQLEGDSVLVGSNRVYAAIHQFGGIIRPKKGRALAFGGRIVLQVVIPARPFLGVSEQDAVEIGSLVSDYLAGAVKSVF